MRLSRSFSLGAVACAIAVLGFSALILRPVLAANSIRNEIRKFHAGPFPAEQLRKWATDHGGSVTCGDNKCRAETRLTNWPLYVLRIAPPTAFDALIETKDGRLSQTSLQLISDPRDGAGQASTLLVVHFSDKGTIESKIGNRGVHVGHEPIGKPPAVVYSVDRTAAPGDIALAYDTNTWCLARIGGCTGPQQAPGAWALRKRNPNGGGAAL